MNPAARWRAFPERHKGGGRRAVIYRWTFRLFFKASITNGAGTFEGPNPDVIWKRRFGKSDWRLFTWPYQVKIFGVFLPIYPE
ncbi:MAG: hypothetical protein CM1200mP29_11920 [Verrucomicrobiota bacterium]|nr:MAG: hypothetical protein CM1200mP29_11920 [Verrucomicrobiota bacterium]